MTLELALVLAEFSASLRRHVPSAAVTWYRTPLRGVAGWLLRLEGLGVLAVAGAGYTSSSGIIARLRGGLGRIGNRDIPAVLSLLGLEDSAMAAYLPLLTVLDSGGIRPTALPAGAARSRHGGPVFTVSLRVPANRPPRCVLFVDHLVLR